MSKNYFTVETEKGIIQFQQEQDCEKRKEIFNLQIRSTFAKLIENIIFVYNFKALENIDILENDCMSYLFECLFKFKTSKGAGFSYFNQICKNWFLQETKNRKKRIQQNIPISKELLEQSEDRKKFIISPFEEEVIKMEFFKLFIEEMYLWRSKVKNKQEKKVLEAVVVLFERLDTLQMLNKKSVYIYLRGLTDLNTKQIAGNLLKLKRRYFSFKKKYHEGKM